MPVSATASSIQSRPLATLRARSLTSPSLVNLQALLRILWNVPLSSRRALAWRQHFFTSN